jgi:hypothetical protein
MMHRSKTTWIASLRAEELVEALEDAQSGLRDLEDAVEGMDRVPEDLAEAVDRLRRALAGF